jgi:hypothetical protein
MKKGVLDRVISRALNESIRRFIAEDYELTEKIVFSTPTDELIDILSDGDDLSQKMAYEIDNRCNVNAITWEVNYFCHLGTELTRWSVPKDDIYEANYDSLTAIGHCSGILKLMLPQFRRCIKQNSDLRMYLDNLIRTECMKHVGNKSNDTLHATYNDLD